MNEVVWLAGAVIVLMVLWLVWSLSRNAATPPPEAPPAPRPRPRAPAVAPEAAAEAIVPEDASRVALPAVSGPPDDLRRIKGVGPKLVTLLGELGVSRYDQIAALDAAQLAHLDSRLGTFRGRAERDAWVEQADFLARGDEAGFEAKFGKLG